MENLIDSILCNQLYTLIGVSILFISLMICFNYFMNKNCPWFVFVDIGGFKVIKETDNHMELLINSPEIENIAISMKQKCYKSRDFDFVELLEDNKYKDLEEHKVMITSGSQFVVLEDVSMELDSMDRILVKGNVVKETPLGFQEPTIEDISNSKMIIMFD